MKRRTLERTAGGIAGLTALDVGATADHSPGGSDNDDAGNACHTDGRGNKEQEDQGDALTTNNPECET